MNIKNQEKNPWWQPAVQIFVEVTGWIAFPIIIALYIGRWLDEKYQTDPWFFLGLTALAFVVSTIGIVRVGGRYIKEVEKAAKEKNIKNNSTHTKENDFKY